MQPPCSDGEQLSPVTTDMQPAVAVVPPPSSPLSYSCAVPTAFGLAFGSVAGALVSLAAGDGQKLAGAARWGIGVAACGGARCLLMKRRGGSEYDDPRQHYDRAIGYGIGAATVPLTSEALDRLSQRMSLPPVYVLRRTLMYSLLGVLVGGAMVSRALRPSPPPVLRLCVASAYAFCVASVRRALLTGLLPA